MAKNGDWLFRKAVMKAGLLDHVTLKKYEKEVFLGDLETPGARLPDILIWQGVMTPEQVGQIFNILNAALETCVACGTRRYVKADGKRHPRCKGCRKARRKQQAVSAEDEDELDLAPAPKPLPQIVVKRPCLAELCNGVFAQFYVIGKTAIVIGRGNECAIVIDDKRASRQHTRVAVRAQTLEAEDFYETASWTGPARNALRGREVFVEDLGSRNGTRINGHRVSSQTLMPGDIIRIGRKCFIFLLPDMPVQRAEANPVGWIHGSASGGLPLRLPVTNAPILVGAASLADVSLRTPGAAHITAQIVAIPKGAMLTDFTGDLPRMCLLKNNKRLGLAGLDLKFSSQNPDATADIDAFVDDPEIATWNAEVANFDLDDVLATEAERVGDASNRSSRSRNFAPQAPPNTCITARSGPAKDRAWRVGTGKTIIGRAKDAGICLADSLVSKHHACIIRRNGMLVVEDMGSENGTVVNGEPIEQYALQPGDVIRIGVSEFFVHL